MARVTWNGRSLKLLGQTLIVWSQHKSAMQAHLCLSAKVPRRNTKSSSSREAVTRHGLEVASTPAHARVLSTGAIVVCDTRLPHRSESQVVIWLESHSRKEWPPWWVRSWDAVISLKGLHLKCVIEDWILQTSLLGTWTRVWLTRTKLHCLKRTRSQKVQEEIGAGVHVGQRVGNGCEANHQVPHMLAAKLR